MGGAGDQTDSASQEDSARISRRNALKAGVAAGVGTMVWAGPQIGRIGAQPAYAAVCTVPWVTVATGPCRNTSCPNSCQHPTTGIKYVNYKASALFSGGGATGQVFEGCGGTTTTLPGATHGSADLTVPTTQGQCRMAFDVYSKNKCDEGITSADYLTTVMTGSVFSGTTATVSLPLVQCASFGISSIFYNVRLECNASDNPDCALI